LKRRSWRQCRNDRHRKIGLRGREEKKKGKLGRHKKRSHENLYAPYAGGTDLESSSDAHGERLARGEKGLGGSC